MPRDAELIAGVVGGVLVGMIAVVVMVAWLRGSRDHRGERGVGSTVFSDVVSNGSRGRLIDHNGAGMHADADDFYGTYGSMDGSGGGRDSGGGGVGRL